MVATVVVNWNNFRETADCVEALQSIDYPEYMTVIVDNGSTDGSGEQLDREFQDRDGVTIVFNDENLGFGGGVNAGIERALADGVEYVLLLNNDARLQPGAIRELVDVALESGAGVVGATILDGDGQPVNPTPNRYPDMFFYSGYRDRLPFVSDSPDGDRRWFETDRVEGAGALLSAELLKDRKASAGYYLDQSLFMYCEEVELAMWCQENNHRAVIATEATITHAGGASSSRAFQLYYLTRNRVLIANQYLGKGPRQLFGPLYVGTRLLRSARYALYGRAGVARAILAGLVDGFMLRYGERDLE